MTGLATHFTMERLIISLLHRRVGGSLPLASSLLQSASIWINCSRVSFALGKIGTGLHHSQYLYLRCFAVTCGKGLFTSSCAPASSTLCVTVLLVIGRLYQHWQTCPCESRVRHMWQVSVCLLVTTPLLLHVTGFGPSHSYVELPL